MTGISDLFASFSQPDEFEVQAQLELFAWAKREQNREALRWYEKQPKRKAAKRAWVSAYVKRRRAEDAEWAARQRERQNRLNREYRARKREQGKCARCPELRAEGKKLCERHLEWDRARRAA